MGLWVMTAGMALLAWCGGFMGYQKAHIEVATECQRLGAFYVGDKTFECKEKK